ncbi:hypothetical protein [Dongia sp.]|uniref:hypothetical protein n=1 Tax=Dongia sp. TaxID=1977262 RepID=UPI0035B41543
MRVAATAEIDETTDGAGPTQDASYQTQMQIEPAVIENGICLRPLTRKDTVVVMMSTRMEFFSQQGLEKERIAVAKLALAHDPRDVRAMLHLSSANYRMMKSQFIDQYPEPKDISPARHAGLIELGKQINLWRSKAEALGWREPTQNADASYLDTMKNAKAVQ